MLFAIYASWFSINLKESRFIIFQKFSDASTFLSDFFRKIFGRSIPHSKPDYFGWKAIKIREFYEIRIKGYNTVVVYFSKFPDIIIMGIVKIKFKY